MVKINTKGDFSIFELSEETNTEKMADYLEDKLLEYSNKKQGNIILKLPENADSAISGNFMTFLKKIQDVFLEKRLSFFVTPVSDKNTKEQMRKKGINITPTLAEAIDMVMMEKLERDLLGG